MNAINPPRCSYTSQSSRSSRSQLSGSTMTTPLARLSLGGRCARAERRARGRPGGRRDKVTNEPDWVSSHAS